MPFRKSSRPRPDRISAQSLADFGRFEFLKEQSGIDASKSFGLVEPLASLSWSGDPGGRPAIVAELRRHTAVGEWEKVGGWKFVREFLDEAQDTLDLIDGGLAAIVRMRVTNLAIHLAPVDMERYRAVAGGPPPNDGFFGPPVFDSAFGPTRQYYLDSAVAAAARRSVTRLPHSPGVGPGGVLGAAKAMWDFGQLIYRGPLVVNPDITFEPNVVKRATDAARDVDHALFMDGVADVMFDPANYLIEGYAPLGATRFAEDYLAPEAVKSSGYGRLLKAAMIQLARTGEPGVMVAPDLLTPAQRDRLAEVRADE